MSTTVQSQYYSLFVNEFNEFDVTEENLDNVINWVSSQEAKFERDPYWIDHYLNLRTTPKDIIEEVGEKNAELLEPLDKEEILVKSSTYRTNLKPIPDIFTNFPARRFGLLLVRLGPRTSIDDTIDENYESHGEIDENSERHFGHLSTSDVKDISGFLSTHCTRVKKVSRALYKMYNLSVNAVKVQAYQFENTCYYILDSRVFENTINEKGNSVIPYCYKCKGTKCMECEKKTSRYGRVLKEKYLGTKSSRGGKKSSRVDKKYRGVSSRKLDDIEE